MKIFMRYIMVPRSRAMNRNLELHSTVLAKIRLRQSDCAAACLRSLVARLRNVIVVPSNDWTRAALPYQHVGISMYHLQMTKAFIVLVRWACVRLCLELIFRTNSDIAILFLIAQIAAAPLILR
jgi:hypothetical protein